MRDPRAVIHAGIANYRWPLKSVAGKTFPAFPVHAQSSILRIWLGAHGPPAGMKLISTYFHKTQQSTNRVHISWNILYISIKFCSRKIISLRYSIILALYFMMTLLQYMIYDLDSIAIYLLE